MEICVSCHKYVSGVDSDTGRCRRCQFTEDDGSEEDRAIAEQERGIAECENDFGDSD